MTSRQLEKEFYYLLNRGYSIMLTPDFKIHLSDDHGVKREASFSSRELYMSIVNDDPGFLVHVLGYLHRQLQSDAGLEGDE